MHPGFEVGTKQIRQRKRYLTFFQHRKAQPKMQRHDVDYLIIGGGPAGLTAAVSLARYRRNVVVFDSNASRAALIPKSQNYPGFAQGILGRKFLSLKRCGHGIRASLGGRSLDFDIVY
jgi:hypothetical protein